MFRITSANCFVSAQRKAFRKHVDPNFIMQKETIISQYWFVQCVHSIIKVQLFE